MQLRLVQFSADLIHFVLLNSMEENSETRWCSVTNRMMHPIPETLTKLNEALLGVYF